MNSNNAIREKVRRRDNFMCEFCRISETDSGGELTIDHFKPRSKGGDDSHDNLIYCCIRCNQYKLDYWPANDAGLMLWNPRRENFESHFLELDDGKIYPLTVTGSFTLRRLRLNRHPLVANRLRKRQEAENIRLLKQYQNLAKLLEKMLLQQTEQMVQERRLMEKKYKLLQFLSDR